MFRCVYLLLMHVLLHIVCWMMVVGGL